MIKVIVSDQELYNQPNEVVAGVYIRQKLHGAGIPISLLGTFVTSGKLEKCYDEKSRHTIYKYTPEKTEKF